MSFFGIGKISKSIISGKSKKSSAKPLYLIPPYGLHFIVNGSFRNLCVLPKYVDLSEWLAVHAFDFFNHVNSFYGAISEFCTAKECTIMSADHGAVEYTYIDSQKRSLRLSAPQYVDMVMSTIQTYINDESLFPTKSGNEFSKESLGTIKFIFKQLFRVLAHIYDAHYTQILNLSAETHFNTLFAHFVCFSKEFDLIEKKDYAVLDDLISELESKGVIR